ncbi:MAG: FtsX-like permease family protein [Acidobacteria bacterium]|nr:FtsX-like permease family protein [Acidobacteriota bacterium]MCW5967504.1 FtsX-like permease family protein [Blastocatellales bacterium]
MKFIVNMAWREMRASWHRLLFFFVCIAIGVGAIITLRSLLQNLSSSVNSEARALLTADVQVSTNNPWSPEIRAVLDRHFDSSIVEGHTEMVELATMMRPVADTGAPPKMVELKAVQAGFPFYGELVLGEAVRYDYSMLAGQGVLLKPGLLTSLNLNVGDRVRIGNLEFTIRGTIEREPGNTMNAFSFGPRVIISYDDAVAAGLLGFGARARYRALFKTGQDGMEPLLASLRKDIGEQRGVNIRSFRYSQDRLSESLLQVENYLSLVGLIILVLGGIGISSVTRVFVQQKMRTIAILKCLGGRSARVLGAYLAQVLALGFAGSLMGLGIAQLASILIPQYFAGRLPFNINFGLTPAAVLQGLGVGLMITLLFSLVPLLEIRSIKPVLVLRQDSGSLGRRWDLVRILAAVVVLAGLIGLAGWQAGSLKIGVIFLGGLAAATLVLNLAALLLIRILKGVRRTPSFAVKQGINSLYRPGNQTRIVLLAVGLGVFFMLSVRLLQANLLGEFDLDMNASRADLYLIDIQKDQRAGVADMIARATGREAELIPTLRARITRLNDKTIIPDQLPAGENRGLLGREYVLTYRPRLDPSETLLSGAFWDETPSSEPEISVEELISRELNVGVGDRITFDVLGRPIEAKITSVRRIDWRNARTGFLVVFRPGSLDDAPQMFIGAINGPPPGAARAQLQRDLVDKYPNVSAIDVFDIIEVARSIIDNVSLAVTFVGGFVFLSGVLILIGSIAMTKYHRIYESAILKTLGAKRKLIVYTILVEYGVLGLLAGVLGSAAAVGLSWAVSKYGLELTWRFAPAINLAGVGLTLLLVVVVGVASSWDVMIKKPLGIMRAE